MFSNNNFTYNKSYRCYEQKNKKEKNDYHNDKNKGDENTRENFLFFYFFFSGRRLNRSRQILNHSFNLLKKITSFSFLDYIFFDLKLFVVV